MPLPTLGVLDKDGLPVTVSTLRSGRAAAADSSGQAWSTEDLAAIGALTEAAPATDTASSGLNGRLQRVAQRLSSLIGLLPTALGSVADSASLGVAFSTEGKAQLGSLTETAPANDTASSGLNGRLQRIAQRITSLITQLPATLGAKTGSAAMAVVSAIDDIKYIDVTLTLDTSAYAASDLLADAQIVAGCVKANDATGTLHSMVVVDEDDNGQPIDFWFANASASFGTENSAPSITDANARTILGYVQVAAADYLDLGGVKIAFKGSIGMAIKPLSGASDIYVAAVLPSTASAATYTASGIKLRLGFLG